jgi:galactokinase/mevalonate kinase-like predicted kinase
LEVRGEAPELDTIELRTPFAELLRDVERHDAEVMCGFQDASMIVHGGLNRMDFSGKHPVNPGPLGTVKPIEAPLPFLLITTGVERLSGSVHTPIADRYLAGDQEVHATIERISELGALGADALMAQNWATLGELMNQNQRLTASLGGSGTAVDELVRHCLKAGALGAKLAGAGMGGTVIALHEDSAALQARLTAAGYERFACPEIEQGVRLEPSTSGARQPLP